MKLLLIASAVLLASLVTPPSSQDKPKDGDKKLNGKGSLALSDARMEFTWEIEKVEDGPLAPLFSCSRLCLGKEHSTHADCDETCDSKCFYASSTHQSSVYNATWEAEQATAKLQLSEQEADDRKTLAKNMLGFGIPTQVTIDDTLASLGKWVRKSSGKKWTKTFDMKCWNKTPCSYSEGFIRLRQWDVTVQYELLYDKKEGATTTVEHGAKGTLHFRTLVSPGDDDDRTIVCGAPVVYCRCEPVQKKPEKTSFGTGVEEFAHLGTGPAEHPLTGTDIKSLVTKIDVPDMNSATLTFADCKEEIFIPCGWELECLDDGQDVEIVDDIRLPPLAAAGPFVSDNRTKTVRVLCLNMHKPEPKLGMRFRLVPPRSLALQRLATSMSGAFALGSSLQVRLWIASGHETLEDMRKTLFPRPDERVYLSQLYEAARVGAIDLQDPAVQHLLDPAYLLADKADPKAGAWLLWELLWIKPRETTEFVKGNGARFAALFGNGDDTPRVKYLAALARTASQHPNGLSAAAAILESWCPGDCRKLVAESPDARFVPIQLMATVDENGAAEVLRWLEDVRPSYTRFAAQNINPQLPSNLQDRATALAGSKP